MKDLWENRNFMPMLLKETFKPFDSLEHIFEVKFDGVRAIIFVNKKSIYIQSRNQKDLTYLFPELDSIKNLVNKNVIFDGEIVLLENGKSSFSALQKRLRVKSISKIKKMSSDNPVVFIVFDILYENKDLTCEKLLKRKEYLNKYKDNDFFVKSKYVDNSGVKLFKCVKDMELEGIVAKDKNGLYHINKRTNDFIKIKNKKRDEFLVGGYEVKKNGFLSLALGEYRNSKFYFVGNASVRKSSKMYDIVLKSKKSKNYFYDYDGNIFYIKPTIKCSVEYLEKTANGHLRHPIVKDF